MINNISKMRRTNQKVRKYLEKKGITKIWIKSHSRWDKDILGLFDGFYIDPERGIILIQIKSNKFGGVKNIKKFSNLHNIQCEIIMFKDREKTPKIKLFLPDNYLYSNA